jgi:hypothetical protein
MRVAANRSQLAGCLDRTCQIPAETRGLQMLRRGSGHVRERPVQPLCWTKPAVVSLRPRSVLWTVAGQLAEDSRASPDGGQPALALRCRIEPYLDQGGACGAAGRCQRSASALEGPAERAPAQTLLAPQITKADPPRNQPWSVCCSSAILCPLPPAACRPAIRQPALSTAFHHGRSPDTLASAQPGPELSTPCLLVNWVRQARAQLWRAR